jgi:hypothetical protein
MCLWWHVRKRTIIEILPSRISPIGCDLQCQLDWAWLLVVFLQIPRTNESVSIGVKTFISENLTRHRYDLLKRLNTLRVDRKIHSVWTHDGSVLVKETSINRCFHDIVSISWYSDITEPQAGSSWILFLFFKPFF